MEMQGATRKARAGWASGATTGAHATATAATPSPTASPVTSAGTSAVRARRPRHSTRALRVFDDYLDASRIEITLQRVDAAALLWRLRLLGADRRRPMARAGRRLAARCGERRPLGLQRCARDDGVDRCRRAGAGERLGRALHRRRRASAGLEPRALARARRAAAATACSPSAPGDHAGAAAAIAPLRGRLARIGGSHAQRDVVEQTLLAAAANGADRAAGRALLAARPRAKAATPLGAWWSRALG
jgi:hypothetical protein